MCLFMALNNHATFSNTCNNLTCSPFAIEQHSERCHNNLARSILGHYVTTSLQRRGMRIIQAAAVNYYFEDGFSCWSRKPVAMPITAEVRDEALEAGQARACATGQTCSLSMNQCFLSSCTILTGIFHSLGGKHTLTRIPGEN